MVRGLERVCGRLRRPQSRRCVAVKAEVPWAAKVPRDWSQAGVSEGDSGISEACRCCRKRRGLDRFPYMGGKGATATGWG